MSESREMKPSRDYLLKIVENKRLQTKRNRARHPDTIREQKRRYRARHPDTIREQKRRYRARHPDTIREQKRRYRARHSDTIREKRREAYQRFQEKRKQKRETQCKVKALGVQTTHCCSDGLFEDTSSSNGKPFGLFGKLLQFVES